MIYIRTLDSTGQVIGWGESPLDDKAGTGETDQELALGNATDKARLDSVGPKYCKVSLGHISEMTSGEKTAVDVSDKAASLKTAPAAIPAFLVVANAAALGTPACEGIIARVKDTGSGTPGMAISSATGWDLFERSGSV